jgi:glycosyltransferase involved in cell wall biosynthesis
MESRPLISVILPVFNGVRYIGEALESVFSQEYQPLEVLVVDDGSTDGVAELLAAKFTAVRYHPQEHLGLPTARNTGLSLATGSLIGFLDADDLWAPKKLVNQVDFLMRETGVDAVFGYIRQFYSPEQQQEIRERYQIEQEILPGIHPDTMLAHAASMRRVGPFDPQVEMGEFLDWFARAQEAGFSYRMLPEVVAFRRIHSANMGIRRRSEAVSGYAHILKAMLDRRKDSRR